MTAEIKPRINFEGRTRLEQVIPLTAPYLLFLDPSDACNGHCRWCPTGNGEALKYKKPQIMDFDLYKKIIDDLCNMPEAIKTLRLYKDGEPLLNKNLHKMVGYAREAGCFGQIDTTTNGLLLTPKRWKPLVEAGIDKIFVSVPQGYSMEYRDQIRNAYFHKKQAKIYVKIIGDGMSEVSKLKFFSDFEDYCDRIFIENLSPCWPDFDIKASPTMGIYGQPVKEVLVCPYIFYSLAINSNGTVSLCFLDYRHHMIIGDLRVQSFADIWLGKLLREFRVWMLQGKRKQHELCGKCGQLSHGAPDDIDPYAEALLEKLWTIGSGER